MTVRFAVAALAATLALAGCATSQKGDIKILEATLRAHSSAMRWGDNPVEAHLAYIDPELRADRQPSSFERSRWEQLRIAGYREQPYALLETTRATQVVQIELINKHTQAVRSIVDRQEWRYDAEQERWWLTTGVPKLEE